MAIYTQQGVEVEIIGRGVQFPEVVAVVSVDDPTWVRIRNLGDLRGNEVMEAYEVASLNYLIDEAARWKQAFRDEQDDREAKP